MEIKILDEKENKFFGRKEIKFELDHTRKPTPKREEVKGEISKKLNVDKNLVVIKKVRTKCGKSISIGLINIYSNKETLLENEPRHLLIRNKMIEDPKEKKAEEKKEEVKEVEKEEKVEKKEIKVEKKE